MASLVTDSDKAAFVTALGDLFDTFYRDIIVNKVNEKVIVSSNEDSYNFMYGNNQTPEHKVELEKTKIIVQAMIRYGKQQKVQYSTDDAGTRGGAAGTDVRVISDEGDARIKVRRDGYLALKGATIIEVDGIPFRIDGPARPQLTFGAEFYTFILKRTN